MSVIPPGLTAGREKLRSTHHNYLPSIAPDSGGGSFLPLSTRCTELSIRPSSSALDSATEVPDGPAEPASTVESCEAFVSDIKEEEAEQEKRRGNGWV